MAIQKPEAIDRTGRTSDVDNMFPFRFSLCFVKEATHVYCRAFDDFEWKVKSWGSAQGIA
jgi:hypothetical protein